MKILGSKQRLAASRPLGLWLTHPIFDLETTFLIIKELFRSGFENQLSFDQLWSRLLLRETELKKMFCPVLDQPRLLGLTISSKKKISNVTSLSSKRIFEKNIKF